MSEQARGSWRDWLIVLVLIVSATLAWSKRIGGGDTFVSLAAGRDALAGKIGLPDEWSFTTEGRPWLNQNWGSHTTYYVSYWLFGDLGPAALKWLAIFGVMLLMVRAATERGGNRYFAAAIVAIAILVGRSYLDVRPHIFTLLFEASLIVVLFQWYKGTPLWAFVGTAIIGLWANMHGGFVFGIGVMGLWLLTQGFMKLFWPGSRVWSWSHLGVLAGAIAVALFLAAIFNPFGPINLTHPLVVENSAVWQSVQEWHPILDAKALGELRFKTARGFGSVTEFLVMMGIFGATFIAWCLARLSRSRGAKEPTRTREEPSDRHGKRRQRQSKKQPEWSPEARSDWVVRTGLFDLGLTLVALAMAFKARRFIPLATVAVAPIISVMLEDVLRWIKTLASGTDKELWSPTWCYGLMGVHTALLFVGLVLCFQHAYLPYHDPNPYYPRQALLMRMVGSQTFPDQALTFLNAQDDVPRELFCDWRWEGYTRWRTSRLQPFCGGRAQQVHSERIARWQIPTPHEGARPLQYLPGKGIVGIDNGQLTVLIGQQKGTVLEIAAKRVPLARVGSAITVTEGGQTIRYEADETVRWRIVTQTDYWSDIDVVVRRTTEPKFEAEYAITFVADQSWVSHRCGWCEIRLKRLANTGSAPIQVAHQALLMRSIPPVQGRPVGTGQICFWQSKDVRYGMAATAMDGGMAPRAVGTEKGALVESVGSVGATLAPKGVHEPTHATTLAFVHHVGGNVSPTDTLKLANYLADIRNCRRVVDQADAFGIKIFLLPQGSWRLAWLLMGSKRWACVFDDGAACVLLRRGDPRNEAIIKKILTGQARYPSEFLQALGTALTRYSLSPTTGGIRQFEKDLKAAIGIEPGFAAYWWLNQVPVLSPAAGQPQELQKNTDYWLEQWKRLTAEPLPRQYTIQVYRCQQIVAQNLYRIFASLNQKAKADEWAAKAQSIADTMTELRGRYM